MFASCSLVSWLILIFFSSKGSYVYDTRAPQTLLENLLNKKDQMKDLIVIVSKKENGNVAIKLRLQ